MFVLADLWTDSVDPEDYANFLQILFFRITRPRTEEENDDDEYNPPTFDLDNIEVVFACMGLCVLKYERIDRA